MCYQIHIEVERLRNRASRGGLELSWMPNSAEDLRGPMGCRLVPFDSDSIIIIQPLNIFKAKKRRVQSRPPVMSSDPTNKHFQSKGMEEY